MKRGIIYIFIFATGLFNVLSTSALAGPVVAEKSEVRSNCDKRLQAIQEATDFSSLMDLINKDPNKAVSKLQLLKGFDEFDRWRVQPLHESLHSGRLSKKNFREILKRYFIQFSRYVFFGADDVASFEKLYPGFMGLDRDGHPPDFRENFRQWQIIEWFLNKNAAPPDDQVVRTRLWLDSSVLIRKAGDEVAKRVENFIKKLGKGIVLSIDPVASREAGPPRSLFLAHYARELSERYKEALLGNSLSQLYRLHKSFLTLGIGGQLKNGKLTPDAKMLSNIAWANQGEPLLLKVEDRNALSEISPEFRANAFVPNREAEEEKNDNFQLQMIRTEPLKLQVRNVPYFKELEGRPAIFFLTADQKLIEHFRSQEVEDPKTHKKGPTYIYDPVQRTEFVISEDDIEIHGQRVHILRLEIISPFLSVIQIVDALSLGNSIKK